MPWGLSINQTPFTKAILEGKGPSIFSWARCIGQAWKVTIIVYVFLSGDAEIISIDAFNKLHYGNGVVVGITFVKVNISHHTSIRTKMLKDTTYT